MEEAIKVLSKMQALNSILLGIWKIHNTKMQLYGLIQHAQDFSTNQSACVLVTLKSWHKCSSQGSLPPHPTGFKRLKRVIGKMKLTCNELVQENVQP